MLKLQNIQKNYELGGGNVVEALRGVTVAFRKSEFVSILGPSGCGKTTLLNVIGGLDHPTAGSLSINGVSTENYTDRDWDTYRNHSIGFVFQTYNLIPHMNVLSNVELAPTISGVSKSERREKSIRALERVGLGDQLYKKPNQLSGGQMQRVAIARALVNDPEILLADEPTGALDSETSVQIMDLLKEVASDRLVVMVTHNADLAAVYSTRIVSLSDGQIVDDTMPLTDDEDASFEGTAKTEEAEAPGEEKKTGKAAQKKASMSFFTALSLSMRNLMSKKGRTILTSFAGSIGIIGIALILAISNGVTAYIDQVQEDTLSAYPISIDRYTSDTGAVFRAMTESRKKAEETEFDDSRIYPDDTMGSMFSAITSYEEHDLPSFKKYFEENLPKISSAVTAYSYSYKLTANIYAADVPDSTGLNTRIMRTSPTSIFDYMGSQIKELMSSMSALAGSTTTGNVSFGMNFYSEILEGLPQEDGKTELVNPVVKTQYDVVGGRWPEKAEEVVLVVDEHNRISNTSLYGLGFKNPDEIEALMAKMFDPSAEYDNGIGENDSYALDDFIGKTYYMVDNSAYFVKTEETYKYKGKTYPIWEDLRESKSFDKNAEAKLFRDLRASGDVIELKIVGIVRKSPNATSTSIGAPIGYTAALSRMLMERNANSEIVKQQKATDAYDVLTGKRFVKEGFKDQSSFLSIFSIGEIKKALEQVDILVAQLDRDTLAYVLAAMKENKLREMVGKEDFTKAQIPEYLATASNEEVEGLIAKIRTLYQTLRTSGSVEDLMNYFDESSYQSIISGLNLNDNTDNTYVGNLVKFGCCDDSTLRSIRIYVADFASKDVISDFVGEYNDSAASGKRVEITDVIGSLLTGVNTVINVVSYVLIAFVAISLVVSSIMIAIITYISVLERTKEIGILRSLGASKKNIRNVFNAETLIEGFAAGLLGVLITALLCLIVNPILHYLTGMTAINAGLPIVAALILIAISMLLTLIAGLIPAQMASKKDPVIALRTE